MAISYYHNGPSPTDPFSAHYQNHVLPLAVERHHKLRNAASTAYFSKGQGKQFELEHNPGLTPVQRRQYLQFVQNATNLHVAFEHLPSEQFLTPLGDTLARIYQGRAWHLYGQLAQPNPQQLQIMAQNWVDQRMPKTAVVKPITPSRCAKYFNQRHDAARFIQSALEAEAHENLLNNGTTNPKADAKQNFYGGLQALNALYTQATGNYGACGWQQYKQLFKRRMAKLTPAIKAALAQPNPANFKQVLKKACVLMPGYRPQLK
jgi:hypothetical protein